MTGIRGVTWFSAEERAGLGPFWRVYSDNYEHLTQVTLAIAEQDPQFGPIVRAMAPEQLAQQNREGRARLERAMAGDWTEYQANLQTQGIMYANLGISYTAWYRLVRGVVRELTPLLVNAYLGDSLVLTRALLAMHAFFDWAMSEIGTAYLEAKQAVILEREEDLATTLNSIGDGVIATDGEGTIVKMNPVAEQLTGWTLAEAQGRPLPQVFKIVNEFTRREVENPASRVLRDGVVVGLANHTALIGKDGRERPIADSGAPILAPDGGIRGVVLVFRDLTEQRDAEEALRRSEARFRKLAESNVIGVVVVNAADTVIEANEPFMRMTGRSENELADGKLQWSALTPAEWRPMDAQAHKELQEVGACQPFEKELIGPDGTRVPVLVGTVALDAGSYVAFVLDISRHKQLEQLRVKSAELEHDNRRIQEANRLKSEFLANMSHELRTPLNAIIGFSELLHDEQVRPDMPQYKEFLGDILASGKHLLQLINDVLDLAKVEAGKLEFHPEASDLRKIIAEVVAILRTTAGERGIEVKVDVDEELTEVVVDPSRLKQVLYNYVSNALKFTPEHGKVWVRARPDGAGAFRVEVEDTGVGISDNDLERLFSEFQQLDSGRTKEHAGTGLGLALTRRLVEAQGGTVGVHSVLGEGSTFYAVLPRHVGGGSTLPPPRFVAGRHAGAPVVLVIEDNLHDQAVIVRALTHAGYAVETAATGAQAIAHCHRRRFDGITLDLLLPDVSGLEVLRAIRGTSANCDVPVIVITVVTEKRAMAGFVVHDILPKPLDGEVLLRSLRRGIPEGRTGTVLVVDDDPGARKLMSATLAQLGYEGTCVARASEGLEVAAASTPLAVVLDLMMPEMDGFEFLEKFRQIPQCRQVPVVVWTFKDLSTEEQARLRLSAQVVVQKGNVAAAIVEELKLCLPPIGMPPD